MRLAGDSQCFLQCGHLLTASLYCRAGDWAGHPEIGLWCSQHSQPLTIWRHSDTQGGKETSGESPASPAPKESIPKVEGTEQIVEEKKDSPPDSTTPTPEEGAPKEEEAKGIVEGGSNSSPESTPTLNETAPIVEEAKDNAEGSKDLSPESSTLVGTNKIVEEEKVLSSETMYVVSVEHIKFPDLRIPLQNFKLPS